MNMQPNESQEATAAPSGSTSEPAREDNFDRLKKHLVAGSLASLLVDAYRAEEPGRRSGAVRLILQQRVQSAKEPHGRPQA